MQDLRGLEGHWRFVSLDVDGHQVPAAALSASRLLIDGKLLVDNSGNHPMIKKAGTVELSAGAHQLVLEFIQDEGGAGCRLLWQVPGGTEEVIPAAALSHALAAEKIAGAIDDH